MTPKQQYLLAYSAFRYEQTYDPFYDYFYRHYPRFDEQRDINVELRSISLLCLGAAYRSYHLETEYRAPKPGRYAEKMQMKQERARTIKTYHTKVVAIEYADGHIERKD